MAGSPWTFADVLRESRARARLTQEELADAAGVSVRTVSDLERGAATAPRKDTVRLLADALHLIGPERAQFEAVALRRPLGSGAAGAAMRSLPSDVASFTGRQRELQELVGAVTGAAGAGGVVGIHAIGGMAGVGKTAFAVHAAHRLADRFPGGQIFLSLHGHTPGRQPVDPADALASLLLTAGVAPGQIPTGLEARMALWRDRLADQQLLLVLDDAVGSDQVRPLLPGAGGSLVLVTSRRHLSALDGAIAVSLDTLPPEDAARLLARLAGRPGLGPGDAGVREIARLCGYLPLAIGMMARQLRHHPAWSAAGRAAELASAVDRLELMETENMSVTAAFNLSYADLTDEQQRLFRRLGLHPGTDIDSYAAAALDATSPSSARKSLDDLYDQYLLTEPARGRYRLHDLVREHARALAVRLDPESDRSAATTRLLDYYQYTAIRADALIARQTRPGPSSGDGAIPLAVPSLADREQALAWARAERANLLACLDQVTETGEDARIIAFTAGISGLAERDGPWADAIVRHRAAIAAARQLGDRLGEANALNDLGMLLRLAADLPAAALAVQQALDIYGDLGDRLGQANALHHLAIVRTYANEFAAAAQLQQQALAIYRDLGDRHGQAAALSFLGFVLKSTGDYRSAARVLDEGLGICRDLGDRLGQADALRFLGNLLAVSGDYQSAARVLGEGLGICRDLGDRLGQANALRNLGVVGRMTGDYPAAARALEEALGIFRDLGDRHGQANALLTTASVWLRAGDYPAAANALKEALGIFRDIEDRYGHAAVLDLEGRLRRLTGDYPAAARALEQALAIYRDLGDRGAVVTALNERGTVHRLSGEFAQAGLLHQQALELARDIPSSGDGASALAGLGRCALAVGDITQARALLRQAVEIFERIGAPETADVAAELDALPAANTGHGVDSEIERHLT